MRTIALGLAAALAITVAPASADEPEPTPPCDESAEYETLKTPGTNEEFMPALVPAFPHDLEEDAGIGEGYREEAVVRFHYRLDVSGHEPVLHATRARVVVTLDWEEENPGDFDLYVYDGAGSLLGESHQFNPLTGPGEQVLLSNVPHCTDLVVDVVNYLAPPSLGMTLDMAVPASQIRA